jgi:hypothetical protein
MTGYLEVIPGTKPFSVAGQKSACGKHYQISNDKRASGKSPGIRKKKGNENLFPKFTTWREQIDGQYWFPTYTRAEDTLKFSLGDIKIREIIKYTNYRRFGSKSRITYEGKEVQKAEPNPGEQTPAEPPKPQ